MDTEVALQSVLSPPILFFLLGCVASLSGSDLELPQPLPKLFSLYLLLAIGFTGGVELQQIGLQRQVIAVLLAAVSFACIVPCYTYPILRYKLDQFNSAAISAAYGSISAVTFITAQSFLDLVGEESDGFMVAALALMETPAIVVGLSFIRSPIPKSSRAQVLLNESVLLLCGSFLIGVVSGRYSPVGVKKMEPFTKDLFYGALCLFLLDMGMLAAKQLEELKTAGPFLIVFSVAVPVLNASIGMFVSWTLGLSKGNALLFAVLCGSASYIAVPAAMRQCVPKASPTLYLGTSLGITFPFNIIIGIPLYMAIIDATFRD